MNRTDTLMLIFVVSAGRTFDLSHRKRSSVSVARLQPYLTFASIPAELTYYGSTQYPTRAQSQYGISLWIAGYRTRSKHCCRHRHLLRYVDLLLEGK